MSAQLLRRLRSMDGAELKFRAAAAIRNHVGRARTALAPPTWTRESLDLADLPSLSDARAALARHDWRGAHLALGRHFSARESRFLIDPRRLEVLAADLSRRFPDNDATERAQRILTGRYDLLGYRAIAAGSPPDWHTDAVHGRRAPLGFWDAVPYLDPSCGDHKVIWEINRHQHFLTLARAFVRSGDRHYYREFVLHLTDWIRANPPLQGINWASMLELAFRALSWTWALHVFAPAASEDDHEAWLVDLLLALERQLEHIDQNLSKYFSPNTHLSGEALALYVCGRVFPELAASTRFENVGRAVLLDEAHRQVLPDGAHAELSAHYHRYSTDFYLLALAVAHITGDAAEAAFRETASRQAKFLRAITDDTGRLPLIGDDDGGQLFPICGRPSSDVTDTLATAAVLLADPDLAVGPPAEETVWICGMTHSVPETFAPRSQSSIGFPHAGYYVCRDGAGNHLVFDTGRHGFLNGGHAHADALAVVVSVGGRPLLIDPGTATYTMDLAVRDRFRSTAMHNTVVVNGQPQARPKGPFHWETRTDAQCRLWQPGASVDFVEGHHDAYAPLRHVRSIFAIHGVGWMIVDHLTGTERPATATAMWHIHPWWAWARTNEAAVTLQTSDGRQAGLAMSVPLRVVTEDGLDGFAPEYGVVTQALCLAGQFEGVYPHAIATFVAACPEWTANAVTALDLEKRPGGESRGAFRIDAPAGTLVVLSSTAADDGGWGPDGVRTSARAALFRLTPTGPVELWAAGQATLASSMQSAGRL